jgi:hypothetical protein
MDARRTLSFITQGNSARRPSRILSNDDEQDLDINGPSDLTIDNLQRRQSSRVIIFFS